jgi:hypothetical protein
MIPASLSAEVDPGNGPVFVQQAVQSPGEMEGA